MKTIITIGGSTSKKSINKILAEYVGGTVKDVKVINIDLNDFAMPLYSMDVEESDGFSKETLALNEIVENADGFVISLAEHNGAYSAAFKNSFDWLSRVEGKVWRNKPMLLLATSPGARGGQTVLDIAAGRFPYMGGNIIGALSFPSFYDNFKDGKIVNEDLNSKVVNLVSEFEKSI